VAKYQNTCSNRLKNNIFAQVLKKKKE